MERAVSPVVIQDGWGDWVLVPTDIAAVLLEPVIEPKVPQFPSYSHIYSETQLV